MTTTPELDRAIVVAGDAVIKAAAEDGRTIIRPIKPTKAQRTYARALLASVWEQIAMARKPYSKTKGADYNDGVAVGFEAALREFQRVAGLEGEG